MSLSPDLSGALAALLGPQGYASGADVPEATRTDASRSGQVLPLALLRPASVQEVSGALRLCHQHGQRVVVQGGMTGLAGGANPMAGEVALSLARLRGVEEIDAEAGLMVLRAGTVLEQAQAAAEAAGWHLPIDLGARGSCQIGGNIATNAGGVRVIRHGMTRDNLLGIEAVLADGTVLSHLNRSVKDNTGYDLRHLICGSEGTLAVVTRAVLRLLQHPTPVGKALCAQTDFTPGLGVLGLARAGATAFEAMWPEFFELNQRLLGREMFADLPGMVVLVETDEAALTPLLEAGFEAGLIGDALVARSGAEARSFWEIREAYAMDRAFPDLINLDVSLPQAAMADFAAACRSGVLARFPGAHVSVFGHVADGNLHLAMALPEGGGAAAHAAEGIVYDLVRAAGGSVSAEHGIGMLKRDWLGHSRSAAETDAMRAIKAALDPSGILNRGRVLGPS
ncbi:MAG: FAD-binding oxidoreductase [Rubellimicrobium sp.]|nr:FAD-binding oxidoreductase [Rubellimicrobium sp.]